MVQDRPRKAAALTKGSEVTELEGQLVGKTEEPQTDSSNGDSLVLMEVHPRLLARAESRLRGRCSDPRSHREDIVQQARLHLFRALKNRQSGYDNPVAVLFTAVDRLAITHRKKCLKEEAVDLNGLFAMQDEYDQRPNARDQLLLKGSFNPSQVWDGIIEIKQKLRHVSDLDLFICLFFEGQTQTEIAKKRNWTLVKVHRAVKKLKRELRNPGTSSNTDSQENLSPKANNDMKTEKRLRWAKTGLVPS